MSHNLTQEELNEMRDWSAKAEQLVRLGMMPVAKLPYIKRALKLVAQDAFLPLIIRKPFYEFIEELLELGLGEAGIYRLIRNKVAANRNDSITNRYMPEELEMNEETDETEKLVQRRFGVGNFRKTEMSAKDIEKAEKEYANQLRTHRKIIGGQETAKEKLKKLPEEVELEEGKTEGHKGREERPWWKQEFRSGRSTTKGDRGGYPIANPFTKKRTHKAERKIAKDEIRKVDEEVEPIEEVSRALKTRYIVKASGNLVHKAMAKQSLDGFPDAQAGLDKGIMKRAKGLNNAVKPSPRKVEEEVGTVPQQPKWLKGKKLERPNPYEDKGSVRNKTKTGDMARSLAHDVEIHEDCTDIKSGTVKKQPHWLKGNKLTRSNPYDDKESKHNKTKSKEIADKANSEVKVSEAHDLGEPPRREKPWHGVEYNSDAVNKAIKSSKKPIGKKEASSIHRLLKGRHKVDEGRDNQYRYDMASGKHIKRTKKASVQAKKDFQAGLWKKKEDALKPKVDEGYLASFLDTMRATNTSLKDVAKRKPMAHKELNTTPYMRGGVKSAKDFKVAKKERSHNEEVQIDEEGNRRTDNPLIRDSEKIMKKFRTGNKISDIAKAQRDFDGRPAPLPKTTIPKSQTEKPMSTGKAVQLKLNMDMVMSGEVLDEDVNYRKTPQGMLQTLAGMVKIKKRHGGKVSVNDRKIASKARNELRRRKYFGAGTTNGITSSFDPSYLELADILAEENVILTEEQLDELKKVLGSYLKKAEADFTERDSVESIRNWKRGKGLKYDKDDIDPDKARKLENREKGIDTAKAKIKAHVKGAVREEVVNELHKDTYRNYIAHSLQDRDDHLLNYAAHTMKGNQRGAGHALGKVQKRTKGVSHAINRLHSPVEKTVHSKPKAVKPSKTSWFKDIDDASNVSDVDSKKRVRKEDFEARFTKTLELFEVKSISDLDEEMTKLFMSLVQNEAGRPEDLYRAEMDKRRGAKNAEDAEKEKTLSDVKDKLDAERSARKEKVTAIKKKLGI